MDFVTWLLRLLDLSSLVRNITTFGKIGIPWFGGEPFLVLQWWDLLCGEDGHYSDLYLYKSKMMTCHFYSVGLILTADKFYLLHSLLCFQGNWIFFGTLLLMLVALFLASSHVLWDFHTILNNILDKSWDSLIIVTFESMSDVRELRTAWISSSFQNSFPKLRVLFNISINFMNISWTDFIDFI